MRKLSILMTLILAVGLFSACSDFFDQVPSDRLSTDKVFESKTGTEQFLASVYTYIPDEANQRFAQEQSLFRTPGPWTAGSDEAEYVWSFVGSHNINNNSLTADNGMIGHLWKSWYCGIHAANQFLQSCHTTVDITENDVRQWKAEARALRAIYYYYLFRAYGPVPLMGDKIVPLSTSASEFQFPRNTVDEVTDYIVSELKLAQADGLLEHVSKSSEGIGRIDQTVAQAFVIQTLMLKASPLFTGENAYYKDLKNNDGTLLFPQLTAQQKIERWQLAANAAADFLKNYEKTYYILEKAYVDKEKTILDPLKSCRQAMRGAISSLSTYNELIFYRIDNSTSTMQYDRTPYHKNAPNEGYRAAGGLGATQEMVDCFFMANGKLPISGYQADGVTPIVNAESGYVEEGLNPEAYKDPNSGVEYAPANCYNMYCNREPRFYANITFSGQKWLNSTNGVFYTNFEFKGNSGKFYGSNDYSKTGYVVRKCAPEGSWRTEDRVCVLMRLSLIYLDYVEALNEVSFDNNKVEILKYINLIRERAGVPQYGAGVNPLPVPADQAAMRAAIRAERTVELMFENTRYFDLRRWNVAKSVMNKPITGMNITADGSGFYQRTIVEDRVFENRQYFFPIPLREANINKALVQNPGY